MWLPTNDKFIANNKVKYIAKTKTWKCLLCAKTSTKYNRRQIINHVNTKHNIRKTVIKPRKPRGTHIEKPNDKILQMESDYGKITIRYEPIINSEVRQRILRCTRCGYENLKKVGIKVHISRVHNEIGKSYDLKCPYCPSIFANLGGLNRHIYNKICPEHDTTQSQKTWPTIWLDMCRQNNVNLDNQLTICP